eukprot:COSAG01_NODE_3103_length_6578_cov_112.775428_3_plen_95_part_00
MHYLPTLYWLGRGHNTRGHPDLPRPAATAVVLSIWAGALTGLTRAATRARDGFLGLASWTRVAAAARRASDLAARRRPPGQFRSTAINLEQDEG